MASNTWIKTLPVLYNRPLSSVISIPPPSPFVRVVVVASPLTRSIPQPTQSPIYIRKYRFFSRRLKQFGEFYLQRCLRRIICACNIWYWLFWYVEVSWSSNQVRIHFDLSSGNRRPCRPSNLFPQFLRRISRFTTNAHRWHLPLRWKKPRALYPGQVLDSNLWLSNPGTTKRLNSW